MKGLGTRIRLASALADARDELAMEKYRMGHDPGTRWRVGSKVGRTIYAMVREPGFKELPPDQHPLIGVMDTPELAEEAVRAHNLDIDIRSSR